MRLSMHRWSEDLFFLFLILLIGGSIIVYIPNYTKKAYENTKSVNYNEKADYSGYRGKSDFPVVSSVKEMREYNNFVIEIDVESLKPTSWFRGLADTRYTGSKLMAKLYKNCEEGMGRFYVAALNSGEKVILLLADVIDFPADGTIRLPVGKIVEVNKTNLFSNLQQEESLTDEESGFYVNMASTWYKEEGMEKAVKAKEDYLIKVSKICIVIMAIYVILKVLLIIILCVKSREK